MKIFTAEQVRQIDKYTIKHEPIASIDLMERAAKQIAAWLIERYLEQDPFVIFAGPGNNGGDGLALARMLAERNYNVRVFLVKISSKLSTDATINFEKLISNEGIAVEILEEKSNFPEIKKSEIIVDAIFGSGLSRPVEGFAARVIRTLNALPNRKIAIDIPSGLFGEDNSDNIRENIFKADITLTLQFPSLSFFFSENGEFTGDWHVLPIGLHPEAIASMEAGFMTVDASFASGLIKERKRFAHKGTYGNVLLIAGCYGMMGAAVLGAKAALRAGSGLVTVHLPRFGYQIVQTALPEALISIDESDIIFTSVPDLQAYSAVGIGPGLGCKANTRQALSELIKNVNMPLVIDADGLNILSANQEWLDELPENTILTPHPKEFDRLAGPSANGYERNKNQLKFARKRKVIVVLKGAYTSIAFPDGTCYFNISGNPGMATAGSGDVLTGIILSLLGQGYAPNEASLLGVYLHGLAGDLAAAASSQEAVIAGDIIEYIGKAYQEVRKAMV